MVLWSRCPGTLPQALRTTRLSALPSVRLERLPLPRAEEPELNRSSFTNGPCTITSGADPPVLAVGPTNVETRVQNGLHGSQHHREEIVGTSRHDRVGGHMAGGDHSLPLHNPTDFLI